MPFTVSPHQFAQTNKRVIMPAIMVRGSSIRTVSFFATIGKTKAEQPRMTKVLMMFEPSTLVMAKSVE